ncbi:MAG: PAS domain S-box protein [Gemmatimonadota bacterium]
MTHLTRPRRPTPRHTGIAEAYRPAAGVTPLHGVVASESGRPDGVAVYDALGDVVCITTVDGTLRFLNRAGQDLLGYVDDTALVGCILPIHTPDARALLLEEGIPAALRAGRTGGDTALQAADGRVFPAAQTVIVTPAQGDSPATLTIVIREVSIERHVSRQVAESQRLFEMIARTAPDVIYLYDPAEQRVVWMNRCPHAYLGGEERDARTISRREMFRLVHRDDLQQLRSDAARIASAYGDGDTVTSEVRFRTSGGTWRWIQTRASVFSRRETGLPLLILGIATDVSAQKKAELRLLAARDAAERSNEDKHAFLTRLSAELHRSIDSVLGLLAEVRDDRDGRLTIRDLEQLSAATECAIHMRRTVSDVTDFTRIEAGEVPVHQAPCDVIALLRETVAAFSMHPGVASAPVALQLPAQALPSLADRARLRQALTHLLAHSLASAGDAEVTVRLRTDEVSGVPIAIEIDRPSPSSDSGDPDELFVPFRAPRPAAGDVHRDLGGTGLGLALTRAICEMIGCTLELVTIDGRAGSAFRITLPVPSRAALLAAAFPATEAGEGDRNVSEGRKVIPLV